MPTRFGRACANACRRTRCRDASWRWERRNCRLCPAARSTSGSWWRWSVAAETIPQLLARNVAERASQEAVVVREARLDYGGLDRASADRAAWLVGQGVNRLHRVGLL